MADTDILIIGAGPTGLVLALWLKRMGISVRIIDKLAEPGTASRALAVQARTLELYRPLGLAAKVLEKGHVVHAVNLWVKGEKAAVLPFGEIGAGLTPYPFLHVFPQDEHERFLIDCLAEEAVTVERPVEFLDFTERGDRIVFRLRHPDGSEEKGEASYIAGCDGARSTVREDMGGKFPGGTYRELFYVADVEAKGAAVDGELHLDLDEADFVAVFPLADSGRIRLIGTIRDERADRAEGLTFDDVSSRAINGLGLHISTVNWFSTYHVHHRVTDHFRKGRAFLLGDAAHIHSPVGGQGMNTGIGDAINLAWKLADVIKRRSAAELLDSYEAERRAFARRLVATTDRVFTFVTADGSLADTVRTEIVPRLFPLLIGLETVRYFMFRTVSQIALNYRHGPLSEGSAGEVQGGDRLPWVPIGSTDNYAPLDRLEWQAHIYGEPWADLVAWCNARRLPLHGFAWQDDFQQAGLERDSVYLIRPDGYVAFAGRGNPALLADYVARHNLNFHPMIASH